MDSQLSRSLNKALFRILSPLVRILLKNRMPYASFCEIAKRVYINQAETHFRLPGRKLSVSRIAVLTGINRRDIARVAVKGEVDYEDDPNHFSPPTRVIRGWLRTPGYQEDDLPRVLPLEGAVSLTELAKIHAGDIPIKAMLDELIRIGAVEPAGDSYRLTTGAFIPHGDIGQKLEVASRAVSELLDSVERNLEADSGSGNFQRSLRFNEVPVEALDTLREWMEMSGQAFLEKANDHFAQTIRETTKAKPKGEDQVRVKSGVGLYLFGREADDEEN